MMLWYLSFSEEDGWKGACIVEAETAGGSIARAHMLGINPGGQVLYASFPESVRLPDEALNRLFTKPEQMEPFLGPIESVWT